VSANPAVEKTTFWQRLATIDRRILYLVMLLVVIIPLLARLRSPAEVTSPVRDVFNAVETLAVHQKPLLISVDFDPTSRAEMYPMLMAILRHAFARKVKVVELGIWQTGFGLAQRALNEVATEYGMKYGEDYVFLGFKAGVDAVILGLGEDVRRTFPVDARRIPLDSSPMMANIRKLNDFGLIVSLSAGTPGYQDWLLYGQARYRVPAAAGTTAVSAADAYPFLGSGQLVGLLAGMKGAAEYEALNTQHGFKQASSLATAAMPALSYAHFAIIILVLIGNVGFFVSRRRK
jgi:hypothetical protein